MPPSACQAHHITWWRHGGTTDITNTLFDAETHARRPGHSIGTQQHLPLDD